jgi:hypothetical protein
MASIWATPEEVQQMEDLLAAAEVWFGELSVGSSRSVVDRVWPYFLRQKRALAWNKLIYVACLPGGRRRGHRSVSVDGWFGFQLHLQREMATRRCHSV